MRRVSEALRPFAFLTGILTVFAVIVAVAIFILLPELRQTARAMMVVAAGLVVVFLLGSLNSLRDWIAARQARYGLNTVIMVAAFIGILSLVNYLGANWHHRFDTTASGEFTLSRHTQTVLKDLKDEVKVIGFFRASEPMEAASQVMVENLLKEYRYHTNKISYEFVDPEEKPAIARQYEIRDNGAIVFTSQGRKQQIFGIGEQDFTGAILNVTGVQQKRVYFLAGHGEPDIDSQAADGFALARQGLETDNYRVERLDLPTTTKVPDDAAVLVVAGPKKPLLPAELQAIEDYLRRGGKAMFLLDPGPQPELQEILKKWGVAFHDGAVVDTLAYAQPDFATPAVLRNQYNPQHQITKNLDTSIFPGATAVLPNIPDDDENILYEPMALTSRLSWQTIADVSQGQPTFDQSKDFPGPLPLAASIEAVAPIGEKPAPGAVPTRMVVVGDSDFATNNYFYSLGNSDLFLNSVNWLGAQEELISIRPKPPQYRRLVITQRAWNWLLWSSIGFLPGVVLLAGGAAWWRRR